ncbi:CpaF family protein [uncultured Stenotrophomonas sp.]|uniref:CpaF family protein n=1 Tax=uncultured Stenotrophomonas sp. TaxID=165438 RepID=UPI0028E44F81|nr:CpaF family protein [uncultured Stenotrophomonas sp.]
MEYKVTSFATSAARVAPGVRVPDPHAPFAQSDAYQNVLVAAHEHLRNTLEDECIDIHAWAPDTVGRYVRTQTALFVQGWGIPVNDAQMEIVATALVKELTGYGPLDDLLHDPAIDEILINGCKDIHVSQGGHLVRARQRFSDDNHLLLILHRILAPLGCHLDASNPIVDARLPNGGRLNAIIAPLAVDGPMVSIRKFRKNPFSPAELVRIGTFDAAMQVLLRAMVLSRCNILVSGGTSSGKTSVLNALASYVPAIERVITVEDTAELSFNHPHVVRLESRIGGFGGQDTISVRDLLRHGLRMRPDRIVVGEVRGAEVLEMLQAMSTVHDGLMATIHADSPGDCLYRIEMLACFAGFQGSEDGLRRQIASAIDFIVQIKRLGNGRRVLVSITEIIGVNDNLISTREMFCHEVQYDTDGREHDRWVNFGIQPHSHKLEPFRRELREALNGSC